ncbi:MAG: hypothetical protein AAGA36_01610 [Pseudomonadota bacterium]
MGRWRKLGRLSDGLTLGGATIGFAAVPTAVHQGGDIYRVFVSARDAENHSLPGWFDFNLDTREVIAVADAPLMTLGALGCFDDAGVMPTWICDHEDERFIYYIGWNQGVSVPFRNAVGLAKEEADGTWQRCFDGPILDRTPQEPHFVASCAVIKRGDTYFNWYLSCTGWEDSGNGPTHHYHIKCAHSLDGVSWQRNGYVAIDFAQGEYAISRPSVLEEADASLTMWFSARGAQYQIFQATSQDGKHWERIQAPVLTPSEEGWDSDMVCYPFVFDHEGDRFMLYNGNGYGQSGVGLAVLEA